MPRTVTAGPHNTWSVVASDLFTINVMAAGFWSLLNIGPGALWMSWTDTITPVIGAEDCVLIPAGTSYTNEGNIYGREIPLRLIADAATQITFTVGAY